MPRSTTTGTIRISPQLWAEFGLLAKRESKTRNGVLVDLVRAYVIERRKDNGRQS